MRPKGSSLTLNSRAVYICLMQRQALPSLFAIAAAVVLEHFVIRYQEVIFINRLLWFA